MTEALSLTERLAEIKREIGAVGKGETMTEGPRYNYRGIDSILEQAHQALITHEVSIIPVDAEAVYESRLTANQKHQQWVSLKVRWEVRGAGECFPGASVGEAMDTSDKATNKAHTAAHKVFLSQLFAIPYSADDPDHNRPESEPEPVPPITSDQYAQLLARIKALPDEIQEDIKPLVRKSPWKLQDIPADHWDEVVAFLEILEAQLADDRPF